MVGVIRIPLLLKVFFVGLMINWFFILVASGITIAANLFNVRYRAAKSKRPDARAFDYRNYILGIIIDVAFIEYFLFKDHKVNVGLVFIPFSIVDPFIGFYLGVKVVQRIRRWGRRSKGIRVVSPRHEVPEPTVLPKRESWLKRFAKDFLEVSKWLEQPEMHPRIE